MTHMAGMAGYIGDAGTRDDAKLTKALVTLGGAPSCFFPHRSRNAAKRLRRFRARGPQRKAEARVAKAKSVAHWRRANQMEIIQGVLLKAYQAREDDAEHQENVFFRAMGVV